MRGLVALLLLAAAVVATVATLRGVDPLGGEPADAARDAVQVVERRARDAARSAKDRLGEATRRGAERATGAAGVRRARCPADATDCVSVRGRVVLVEDVDPDGDGDLHVVIADGSVTAPGFTAVDVRPGLRPARSPRIGDVAAAAGPVQRGSFGQSQIHALTFRTRRGG